MARLIQRGLLFFEISPYRLMAFIQIGQRRLQLFNFGGLRLGRSARLGGFGLAAAQRFANGLRPGVVPDIDQLSAQLQAATNATLGRPGARLLLGTVMAV